MSNDKVDILIDKDILFEAVLRAVCAVIENPERAVIVPLGQVQGISVEVGAYHTEKLELTDEDEVLEIELTNPGIYEQLDLKFLH
jgi:hypothetical protein